jgi:8-oxo-dGTP pyrophosphatase MutT (NUDIX family)
MDEDAARLLREVAHIPAVPIGQLDLAFAPRAWPFAQERRSEIAAHFEMLRRGKPELYNGPVLLMHNCEVAPGALRGGYLQTDFASFMAWRDWSFPDPGITNCFALGALRGSDGGYLLGVMGTHTINAGHIYFPGGTPDPSDIINGRVDLAASVCREVFEETGLAPEHFDIEPGWTAILAGPRIAMIKVMHARESTMALRTRILDHIAAEDMPELAGMHIVGGPADLSALIPPFVLAYFAHIWKGAAGLDHQSGTQRENLR